MMDSLLTDRQKLRFTAGDLAAHANDLRWALEVLRDDYRADRRNVEARIIDGMLRDAGKVSGLADSLNEMLDDGDGPG